MFKSMYAVLLSKSFLSKNNLDLIADFPDMKIFLTISFYTPIIFSNLNAILLLNLLKYTSLTWFLIPALG